MKHNTNRASRRYRLLEELHELLAELLILDTKPTNKEVDMLKKMSKQLSAECCKLVYVLLLLKEYRKAQNIIGLWVTAAALHMVWVINSNVLTAPLGYILRFMKEDEPRRCRMEKEVGPDWDKSASIKQSKNRLLHHPDTIDKVMSGEKKPPVNRKESNEDIGDYLLSIGCRCDSCKYLKNK